MATTTASDWIASAEEALAELRKICSQVFITGLSMGAR
jgi:carboxylesterase